IRETIPWSALPVSGVHASFDVACKALHNTLHLGHIGSHNVEHQVANTAVGIAANVVLDRCRTASQRLTNSPTVSREGDRSTEGNGAVLWVTTGLAGLVTQACHSRAHLVGCEAGWRTQSNGMPAVSQPGGTADSGRCVTTDPDRRMRLARWFGRK